jgi:hypothetical protein
LPSDLSDGYEKQKQQKIERSAALQSYPLPFDSSDGYKKQIDLFKPTAKKRAIRIFAELSFAVRFIGRT